MRLGLGGEEGIFLFNQIEVYYLHVFIRYNSSCIVFVVVLVVHHPWEVHVYDINSTV